MNDTSCLSSQPHCDACPWNPATLCRVRIYPTLWLLDTGHPSITPHNADMNHRPAGCSWKPPPVDRILFNFDRIYTAGVFWRVVSPQLLESQCRLMSAIALMAGKLKATLPPHNQSPPEGRHRRHVPTFNRLNNYLIIFHRFFTTPPPPDTKPDTLIARHKRELRLYTEAAKRAKRGFPLDLQPTAANITFAYNHLVASLEFWEDAKFWHGMPWWRNPNLDFQWAPPRPLSEITDCDPSPVRVLVPSSGTQRTVTFGEGEKESSPKAPAHTRVPRCSTATRFELPKIRVRRHKLISV